MLVLLLNTRRVIYHLFNHSEGQYAELLYMRAYMCVRACMHAYVRVCACVCVCVVDYDVVLRLSTSMEVVVMPFYILGNT